MKKGLNTIASTRADLNFRSEGSELGFITYRQPSYQVQLQSLLTSMSKVCEVRLAFLFRDAQTIYTANSNLLKDLLKLGSPDEFWQFLVGRKGEELKEQGQIRLLIKLLEEFNQRKMKEGDLGNVQSADKYRKIVQWFIPQIVQYEHSFLDKLEREQLKNWEMSRDQRFNEFERNQNRTISQFNKMDQNRQENLFNRFSLEHTHREKQFKDKIQRELYKIDPSQLLRETKEKALLKKLGTYRLNKMNPFQDEGYSKDLHQAVDAEQIRKMRLIEHLKQKEKEKISRQHKKINDSQQMYAQSERDKMMTNLSFEKTVLTNYEDRLKERLRHSLHLSRNRKLSNLKKTLEAFIKYEDTEKINEILESHEQNIRHNHDITQVIATQAQINEMAGRYSTLDGNRSTSVRKQLDREKKEFERKIKFMLQEETQQMSPLSSGRKSLVDLYDKSLKKIDK